jgi:EmrB/QacA subfamily drug resistance transporter
MARTTTEPGATEPGATEPGATEPGKTQETGQRRPVALTVLCTLLFLTFLDNTVVSVALSSIQGDLKAGVSSLQWVVGAYALPFAALMLTFGMLSDQFGRKKVMLAGAGLYCAGAALSALAPGIGILITGRAVMGVGAAASEPGTLSMIRQLYADRASRNRALGIWAAVSGFALALGPVLGGLLVGLWSWRGIFWFDVTFGLAALIAGAKVLPENSDPRAGRVDIPGTLLGFCCVAALAYAVIEGETSGFARPEQLVLYVIGAAAAAGFAFWERRCAHPLLDPKFLRVPQFVTPNVVAFCCYFATFAIFFFTALYLSEVAGYSGYRIAGVFLPMAAVMIAASVLAGRWTTAAGVRGSLVAGCVVFIGGLFATNAVLSSHPDYPLLAVSLAVAGAGLGSCVVPITSSVLEVVPGERSGMAASATNTSREIGAVAGVVVLGAIVSAQLKTGLITEMMKLHLPAAIQDYVLSVVQSGGGVAVLAGGSAGQGGIFGQLLKAGYAAFGTALHDALYLSAALMVIAALLAATTLRRST